ncbi:zinc-dependent alcohol dehydrogenase [Gimesia maris]|uniref:Glutathione-independent formaldehyde dehydrogenase n=1 Tax=Gimesia maris TaxID=122 RepID=A0ABX5YHR9_9PLAN|nr:zinc-dependent alcohol dehydrogenase [Gimesia maris]EDL59504.1 oxidoreductase, zinc-binding dehydrogenase family protein [Gimesia maris DSM 8797]QEG15145.1 Glutathione-independent formaldehyde dehydrogenase [Gimesia maris]QGQ31509.1 glutathione-dependent formaldehyde dehydrogenase [Gimesia maris]
MKAVVFHGVGDIRLDNVPEPKIRESTDAIVRLTSSAICGTDLHFIRGTFPGMQEGTILGHEGVGIIEEVGSDVRNFSPGDRVVIPSTIGCGSCAYCRDGYYAQCDNANPNGKDAGTAFFGGPQGTGPIQGLQAEYARIPFANVGLVRLPDNIIDEQAILLSDIFPTGYFGAHLAEIKPGDTVAVFGCGPVGVFAIISAHLFQAGRVIAVDCVESRLEIARSHGAEVINFEKEDPVETIKDLTGGIGVDRVIDAVGVDALHPHRETADENEKQQQQKYQQEQSKIIQEQNPQGDLWVPGDAPSQALRWSVQSAAKAGTLSIIGVYPPQLESFPIGQAMNKNLTINMGNCNHRRYLPQLVRLVNSGAVEPSTVLTQETPIVSAIEAYESFDQRQAGWMKVELLPAG